MSKRRHSTHRLPIFADAVNRHLYMALSEPGHGTAAMVERGLGLYGGYFAQKRKARTLDVGVLLGALHILNLDYDPFLRQALSDIDADDVAYAIAGMGPPNVESPEARRILARHGVPEREWR